MRIYKAEIIDVDTEKFMYTDGDIYLKAICLVIPEGVAELDYGFGDYTYARTVYNIKIPDSLKIITDNSFDTYDNLRIIMGNNTNLSYIGYRAFSNIDNLNIDLSKSTSLIINRYAFTSVKK